mgnify:CR=1 FL=1
MSKASLGDDGLDSLSTRMMGTWDTNSYCLIYSNTFECCGRDAHCMAWEGGVMVVKKIVGEE